MTQLLMLDAAYPPLPDQLNADCDAVGAGGVFAYLWGPIVNWTPDHVTLMRAHGKIVIPIIVPGNFPGDPINMLHALPLWGFHDGPVMFDFETNSEPALVWWKWAQDTLAAGGYHAEPYGTTPILGIYDPTDDDWVAEWIRTGVLDPIPNLPPNWEAWQFVNDITINGHQYDASVINPDALGVFPDMTPEQDAALTETQQRSADIWNLLTQGRTGAQFGHPDLQVWGISHIEEMQQALADILLTLHNVPPGTGLTAAQAQQLSDALAAVNRVEVALKQA